MAGDNQLIIEILTKYLGKEEAAAAAKDLAGLKEQTGDLSQSLPEGSELWKKYKGILSETSDSAGVFTGKSREMRIVAEQLNHILPGLGLAFRGVVTAMGPIAIVALSIQAAVTWWKYYKEGVEAAAKANEESMDKVRKSTHDAVDEISKFKAAMDQAASAVERDKKALTESLAILDAQIKARKELREAMGIKGGESEAGDQAAKLALINNTMATVSAQMKPLLEQQAALEEKMRHGGAGAGADWQTGQAFGRDRAAENKQFAETAKTLEDLKKYLGELEQQSRTLTNTLAIQAKAEHAAALAKAGTPGAVVEGVAAAESAIEHGKKMTDSQKDLLRAFMDFARDHGASNDEILKALHLLTTSAQARQQEAATLTAQLAALTTGSR